jgi:ubiquinone/menaquinone biosynthesis C-methylase UbiE
MPSDQWSEFMNKESGYQLKGRRPEIYETFWVPALMGPCAEDLVAAANVEPGDKVLDVACGTGVVTREAAHRTGSSADVTGADINEAMLDTARQFAIRHGMPDIHWELCDAASMPFADATFDVVLCQQGLQFMPDRPAAVAEMARVLVPGGRLAISVWKSASPFGSALRSVLDRAFGEGTTASWQAASSLGDRDELRSLAENAGFSNCHVRFDVKVARHPDPEAFVSGVLAATPLADDIAEMTDHERGNLVHAIIGRFDTYMDDGGMAYPAECHTITAVV